MTETTIPVSKTVLRRLAKGAIKEELRDTDNSDVLKAFVRSGFIKKSICKRAKNIKIGDGMWVSFSKGDEGYIISDRLK